MWRRRWVDRSLGIGMSCKEENTYAGRNRGVLVIWPCIKFIFYFSYMSEREREKRFFFKEKDSQFDKNNFY